MMIWWKWPWRARRITVMFHFKNYSQESVRLDSVLQYTSDTPLRKQPTFHDATTGFPRNDVWETSAEIPYWWRVTTSIWVMFFIGWSKFPQRHKQSEALSKFGKWNVRIFFFRLFIILTETIIYLVYSPKFYITIVSNFSWVFNYSSPKRNGRQWLWKFFWGGGGGGGKQGALWSLWKWSLPYIAINV